MADSLPWEEVQWLRQAQAWIETQLGRLGLQASAPPEQIHVRPWSTVLRVPTTGRTLYFKACAASVAHEPALSAYLAQRQPDCALAVYGLDPERAWMLIQDGGPTLRSRALEPAYLKLWAQALRRYAALQRDLAPEAGALLGLGLPDRRLSALPARLAQLLDEELAPRAGAPHALSRASLRRLQDLLPAFERACRRLADYGLPPSLHHDDLHDANIFVQAGQFRFADWGESCLAHPFFSLLVTLRSAAYQSGLEEEAEAMHGLREAYLEAWTAYAPLPALRQAAELASRLAMANRALTWQQVVRDAPPTWRARYESAAPGWLDELLQAEARQPLLV
jgi:hypothetical protein